MTVCTGGIPEKEIGNGASITRIPEVECDHKHSLDFVSGLLDWDGNHECSCYSGCIKNEVKALYDRHIMKVPESVDIILKVRNIGKWFVKQLPDLHTGMWDELKVLQHKAQSQRKRVERAFQNLRENGWLMTKDAILRAFIKFEKAEKTSDIRQKAPRLIQHRSYEFCARLAQYIMPMEEHIWHWDINFKRSPISERVFAKRMNSFQRAKRLRTMFERFKDPVIIDLDYSRLDAHLLLHVLESIEFATYRRFNGCGELDALLRCMRHNVGFTRNGIRYTAKGRKASGEYVTSLGDSLINFCFLKFWTRVLSKVELLVDGDDSVIMLERDELHLLDEDFFTSIGFTVKTGVTRVFEETDFCQCRPVEVAPGKWRMVRNPWRVMSRTAVSDQHFIGQAKDDWVASVGMGELACNMGVPILQNYAMRLMTQGKARPKFVDKVLERRPGESKRPCPKPILSCARVSFALAWNVWPSEQEELEQTFSRGVE